MTFDTLRARLRTLLEPGVIGDFDHIELMEVIGTPPGGAPINVLTVAVLSQGRANVTDAEKTDFLTPRIKVDGFKDWSFGICRTLRPVGALDEALKTLAASGRWVLSGRTLRTGRLHPEPGMFAPPDGTVDVPLNRVLKNNFWAGSHVFRLADRDKTPFAPFFADRRRLQALSDAVAPAAPLAFAGLADLLGDVLIQIPVTVLTPDNSRAPDVANAEIAMAWRGGVEPRDLVAAARTRMDQVLTGADVSARFRQRGRLRIEDRSQPMESETWDAEAGVLLAATASTSTLKRILLDKHTKSPEPRLFSAPDTDGRRSPARVTLFTSEATLVGEVDENSPTAWLRRRQDLEEKRLLDLRRDFVQYRPRDGLRTERAQALADVRFLIGAHGRDGVDLWDPYLTGDDLLQTLFWCHHSQAPLRALTDGREPPAPNALDRSVLLEPAVARVTFDERERAVLDRDAGNREGLRLEFRTRSGPKGWAFHDRFLIFPNAEVGPKAWSLGTSVNSLGLAHHILQRVSNAAMVAGAFDDLWAELDEPRHVIWRSW